MGNTLIEAIGVAKTNGRTIRIFRKENGKRGFRVDGGNITEHEACGKNFFAIHGEHKIKDVLKYYKKLKSGCPK